MFHDGCTAGPLSDWLNGIIGPCCAVHDGALDHSTDFQTFLDGNAGFFSCVAQSYPLLALVAFLVVSSPLGWVLYRFGPKRK